MISLDNATVYLGSNLDILPTLPDNSVDSIVTDPPYELGFMGKKWDSSGIAYSVELWAEKGKSGFAAGYDGDGWTAGSELGRWPANIILDEYTAGLLDEQSGDVRSNGNHSNNRSGLQNAFVGGELINPVSSTMYHDKGGASRFFYVAKASKKDRNEGLDELPLTDRGSHNQGMQNMDGGRDTYRQNFHPTVKPTALMEYLIRLVTPAGGVVLDPFTGSGSTGKAALLNGYRFIGCELTEEYLPIIEGRLKHAAEQYAAKATEEETKEQETLF
jgi:site-specific DNA-methyltransferase (adenine-specific)